MKLASPITHVLALFLSTVVLSISGFGQTQPIPFNLSAGAYHFTSWDSLSAAGTYPESMTFQFVPSNHIAPFYDDSATDFSCPYNMSKRPRIIGYMSKGVGFLTTSNSQYNDCNSGTADQRFMGDALLSLNAEGRTNIRVQWTSETLIPGDGNGTASTPRIWNLRLQYRVGSSGNFTDVPGPIEFIAGITTGDALTLGPTALPAACNNKPVVQVRWIYFESSAGSAGTRPRLRLDDINVLSDPYVGIDEAGKSKFELYPNPAQDEFFIRCTSIRQGEIKIINSLGKAVMEEPINASDNRYNCSDLTAGVYFIQLIDSESKSSSIQKLIIR
jgi:hypothetical protein